MVFSKKIYHAPILLFLLVFTVIMTACSQFNTEQTGTVTFKLYTREAEAQDTPADPAEQTMLKVEIKGDYQAFKEVPFTNEAQVAFENIPTGKKIYIEANVYSDGLNTYTGTSSSFKVKANNNDVTIYLKKIYSVNFDTNGGTGNYQEQRIVKGEPASEPQEIPEREPNGRTGYDFSGWYTSPECEAATLFDFATPITADITLYAGWIETSAYIVTFDVNGGSGSIQEQLISQGKNAREPDTVPQKEADDDYVYIFAGWYKSKSTDASEKFDFETPITADITLYAGWAKKQIFTVTFNTLGGQDVESQKVVDGEFATEPATPIKAATALEAYSFDGWYTSNDGGTTLSESPYNFETAVTGNITLYAKWNALVRFDIVDIEIPVEQIETISVTGPTDNNDGTYTFTAESGFDSYIWKFDGFDKNPTTNVSYSTTNTFTTPNMSSGYYGAPGTYNVTLLATKTTDGVTKYYSYTTQIIKD